MRKMVPSAVVLGLLSSGLVAMGGPLVAAAREGNRPPFAGEPPASEPAAPNVDPADVPIAYYDGGTVTRGEYESWLRFLDRDADPDRLAQRVATIALHEVQAEQARALGLDQAPDVRMAIFDFENRLLHEILRQHLAANLEVSDEEIAAAVEARQDAFVRPRRVRLYNILRRYPAGSDDAAIVAVRKQVAAIRARIVAGEDFKTVARTESVSQTRFRDGLIGWVRAGQLAPAVEKIALALEPGMLSPVLATEDGFTLLWCEQVDAASRPPLEEIRGKVAKNLRRERFEARWQPILNAAEGVSLDLFAARTGRADGLVAKLPSGARLTVVDVDALLRVRGVARRAADLSDSRLESVLRNAIEQVVAAEEARSVAPRSLDRSAAVQERLAWSELTTLSTALVKKILAERFVPLKAEEIRAYYDAHQHRYKRPAQTGLEVIMLVAERENFRQRFRQVESLEAALRAGEIAFAEAARRHSEHASAARGGEAGWLDRTQVASMGPNVLKTVEALGVGEMSGLVQQPEGLTGLSHLWLVRKTGVRPSKRLSFAEAERAAENGLGNERTRALQAEIRQEAISRLNFRLAAAKSE